MYTKIMIILITLFSFISAVEFSEINSESALPESIIFAGEFVRCVNWSDTEGEHFVLLTETAPYRSSQDPNSDEQNAELYAYHFLNNGNGIQQLWRIFDFSNECPVDIEASHFENFPQITDLDADGIKEIWIMYKTNCRGDVSPSTLKVIMYEGSTKYAMRGTTRIEYSPTVSAGGDFAFDTNFENSPIEFTNFAEEIWRTYSLEMSFNR